MNYALHVSQIQPFIENEEGFRKFCHGGPKQNPIFDRFLIFLKNIYIFIVRSHMFFAGQAKQAYSNYTSSTKFSTILVVLNLVPWYWLPVVRALVLGLTRISLIKNLGIFLLGPC